jgi:hypothetical protein
MIRLLLELRVEKRLYITPVVAQLPVLSQAVCHARHRYQLGMTFKGLGISKERKEGKDQ